MFLSKAQENPHKCRIKRDSTSCLPKLPPYANCFQRMCRKLKKHLLVSEVCTRTKLHFRSRAAVFSERRRQVSSYPSYVIHPYSDFIIYREVTMSICWFILFFTGPFTSTFGYQKETLTVLNAIVFCTEEVVVWLLFSNMLINFFTGYHNPRTKEIILDPKKIAHNYLKTYFVFDLLAYTPFEIFLTREQALSKPIFILCGIRLVFMCPRIRTMFDYFKQITMFFRFEDALHEITCRILLSLFILHWSACILYFANEIYAMFDPLEKTYIQAGELDTDRFAPGEKYTWCMYLVVVNFYRIGMFRANSKADFITLSIITLVGVFFHAYIIAVVLKVTGAANAPENQYEELLQQMHMYLRSKNMPLQMKMRVRAYYEHRFQKRYFQERAILSTLSEHLLHEIKLHTCQHLIEKVSLFAGLSKSIIGSIIGEMELEVYLTNDVIVRHGFPADHFYIISCGTVALTHFSGVEVCHLHDGEVFGVTSVFYYHNDVNIVAAEICEIFRISASKFQKYMSVPSIAKNLSDLVKMRREVVRDCLSRYESELRDRQEVLYKVRQGEILERGHFRH